MTAVVPAVVYRHFGPDGALLYIGSTGDIAQRTIAHSAESPWFVGGVRVEWHAFGSLDLAREAEAAAILAEHPRWNIAGRAKDHPDGLALSHWHVGQMFPGTYREHLVTKPYRRGMNGQARNESDYITGLEHLAQKRADRLARARARAVA